MFQHATGIALWQTQSSRVVHNWIHDFGFAGISLNGTQGYGLSLTGNNLVELNHVHNIGARSTGGAPLLNDQGGIYMIGERPGTKVRLNLVHDIAASRYGGHGIYFDEGTTGVLAEQNIVYRVTEAGLNMNHGRDNVVRNNIFALSSARTGAAPLPPGQIQKSVDVGDPRLQFTFDTNTVYWQQGTLLGSFPRSFTSTRSNVAFNRNVYWKDGGNTTASSGVVTWDSWQASGMDRSSVIADPLFEAPDRGNFALKPDSPAWKLGWQPIDLSGVGPRTTGGQAERMEK